MKRSLLAIGLICVAAISSAQVKMNVFAQGQKVGTATLSRTLTSTSKTEKLQLVLTGPQGSITVLNENTYRKNGSPTKKIIEIKAGGQTQKRVVTYTSKGAQVVNNGAAPKTVNAPAGANFADASEFWFITAKPKAGAKVVTTYFNIDQLKWETQTTTYVGKKSIKVGGKTVSAHHIKSTGSGETNEAWVDDKGMPWALDGSGLRFERI